MLCNFENHHVVAYPVFAMRMYFYLLPVIISSIFVFSVNTPFIWVAGVTFILVGALRNVFGKFKRDEILAAYRFFHEDRGMQWLKTFSGGYFIAFNLWAMYFFIYHELSAWRLAVFIYSYIAINGAFSISLSHELMHSRRRVDRFGAVFLLIQNGFFYLISDHLYTHHRFAATSTDPATARRGENLYHYFYRSIKARFKLTLISGKTFPANRRKKIIRTNFFYLFCCLIYWVSAFLISWQWVLCLSAAYVFVPLIYESVTYIQHYGLSRENEATQYTSPMTLQHSWNCFYKTSAYMHYMVPVHSIHHASGKTDVREDGFYGLEMPLAFSSMLLRAWMPSTWFKLMANKPAVV